jgi:hypothetical protein
VSRDRPGPDANRLIIAKMSGIAQRNAHWGALTEADRTAGAAELRGVAGDRQDLLAWVPQN